MAVPSLGPSTLTRDNALGIGVPAPVSLAGAVLMAASPFRPVQPVRPVSPGHGDDLSWAKLVRT